VLSVPAELNVGNGDPDAGEGPDKRVPVSNVVAEHKAIAFQPLDIGLVLTGGLVDNEVTQPDEEFVHIEKAEGPDAGVVPLKLYAVEDDGAVRPSGVLRLRLDDEADLGVQPVEEIEIFLR